MRAAGWGGGSGRPSRSLATRGAALLLTSAFLVPGCSSNPATGKKQLNFYSQAQEIEIGRNADQQISAQLGVLEDARLQGWVSDIGQRLAAKSERPDLPWSFKVIDDPIVNAFALPGGFIYVTRGLLGHLRNEAELASVLGHEIGHVTAQHGVNQMSKAQLAQGGLILGAIFAPGLATDLASTGLGLLFLKYGRDDERQADDLGLRYMAGSGFDPREMPGVFDVLRRVGELQGAGRIPGWLSSHPDPGARAERASQRLAERDYPTGEVGEESYLRHTDGLVFGANPRLGYFDGRRFLHPEMGFSLEIPAGWAAANEASRVVGLHPEKIAQVDLRLAPGSSPEEAARAFLGQQGLNAGDTRSTRVNGLAAVEASFSVPRQGGSAIVGQANFVRHGERIFQLTALAVEERVGRVRGELSGFLASFAPLGGSQRDVQPQRLRVVRLDSPMTFEEFLRRHPSDERREVLELINGVEDPNRTLPAGTLLKRVEGRAVGTQKIEPGRS
jgi:predicted Zn-dependent protease